MASKREVDPKIFPSLALRFADKANPINYKSNSYRKKTVRKKAQSDNSV